jgi:hypothetical protein
MAVEDDHVENNALKLLVVQELNKAWVNELHSLTSQFINSDYGD